MEAPERIEVETVCASELVALLLMQLDNPELEPWRRRGMNQLLGQARRAMREQGQHARLAVLRPALYVGDDEGEELPVPRRIRCVSCGMLVNACGLFCPNCGDPVEDL